MTIRDLIKKKMLRVAGFGLVPLVVATMVILGVRPSAAGSVAIFFILAMYLIAVVLFSAHWVRCPKCAHTLINGIAAGALLKGRNRTNYCPYCGVNFDTALSQVDPLSDGAGVLDRRAP